MMLALNHNGIELEMKNRKATRKFQNVWRLNITDLTRGGEEVSPALTDSHPVISPSFSSIQGI